MIPTIMDQMHRVEQTPAGYDNMLQQYLEAMNQRSDATNAARLGTRVLGAGMMVHPALALVGGLMSWRAKNSLDEADETAKGLRDKVMDHDDFNVMDLFGRQQGRGFGDRFKGIAGSFF